jgi:hypothetical protein
VYKARNDYKWMLTIKIDDATYQWHMLNETDHAIKDALISAVYPDPAPPMVLGGKTRTWWSPWMDDEDPDSEDYKRAQADIIRAMNRPYDYEDLIEAEIEDRDDLRARGIYQDPEELE